MSVATASFPLATAQPEERVDYLKKVLIWTSGGLVLSGASGLLTAGILYAAAAMGLNFVFNQWVMLAFIFGSYGVAQFVAPKMVFGQAKVIGFGVGAFFQGISMGYLLLAAISMGIQDGNPFGLVGAALILTSMTGMGMTAYVWTGPKDFSMIGGLLSAVFVPMLVLMAVSFIFPALFGGVLGTIMCAVFVVISAAGLLYQINQVMHQLRTDMHIEGAYLITMGVLILFWNILSLLMRLNRR